YGKGSQVRAGRRPMGITTLMFCLVGFVSTLILTLAVRIGHGATWRDLIRNRCYEVVPLRGLFWIVLGLGQLFTSVVQFLCGLPHKAPSAEHLIRQTLVYRSRRHRLIMKAHAACGADIRGFSSVR